MGKFKVGDAVGIARILGDMDSRWIGLRARVIGSGPLTGRSVRLDPLSPRPDGFAFSPFLWNEDQLELVTPAQDAVSTTPGLAGRTEALAVDMERKATALQEAATELRLHAAHIRDTEEF